VLLQLRLVVSFALLSRKVVDVEGFDAVVVEGEKTSDAGTDVTSLQTTREKD
jgi:hypothetical protein